MSKTSKVSITYGCGSSVGGRPFQEDRLVAVKVSSSEKSDKHYFGVFDGHAGDKCSSYLAANLHSSVAAHSMFHTHPNVALKEVWGKFDNACYNEFYRLVTVKGLKALPMDGSTATVCVISDNDLYIANCGDSSAFAIFPDGKTECLTENHSSYNVDEVDRCVKAGGGLASQSYSSPWAMPFCCMESTVATQPRVQPGNLLTTRSFGNFHAKLEHLGGQRGVIVHSHGPVKQVPLSGKAHGAPKFVILASNGIWDVLSIEEVSKIMHDCMAHEVRRTTATSETDSVDGAAGPADGSESQGPVSRARKASLSSPIKRVYPEPNNTAFFDADAASRAPAYGPTASPTMRLHEPVSSTKISNAEQNDTLIRMANTIVATAIESPKWDFLGRSADNASVIIVAFADPLGEK
jgi:serine/threonine protein phosphatase PrpC